MKPGFAGALAVALAVARAVAVALAVAGAVRLQNRNTSSVFWQSAMTFAVMTLGAMRLAYLIQN